MRSRSRLRTRSLSRSSCCRPPFFIAHALVRFPIIALRLPNIFTHEYDLIGERRIRVVTLALPTTTNLSEVYASADQVAIATFLANKAVERSLSHKLEDARDAVVNKMVEILTAYKSSMTAAGSGASAQLSLSENMRMLPVLLLGLLKNVGGHADIPVT